MTMSNFTWTDVRQFLHMFVLTAIVTALSCLILVCVHIGPPLFPVLHSGKVGDGLSRSQARDSGWDSSWIGYGILSTRACDHKVMPHCSNRKGKIIILVTYVWVFLSSLLSSWSLLTGVNSPAFPPLFQSTSTLTCMDVSMNICETGCHKGWPHI